MSEAVPEPSSEDYDALFDAGIPADEIAQGAELLAQLREAYERPEFPQSPPSNP